MRHRLIILLAALAAASIVVGYSSAGGADAICEDGWYSEAEGQGACSHHGGVDYWLDGRGDPDTVVDDDYVDINDYSGEKGGTDLDSSSDSIPAWLKENWVWMAAVAAGILWLYKSD